MGEIIRSTCSISPVKKMIVEDLNGDNCPDVLIAGNDYTYDLSSGYYDANKGILLLNKGTMQEKGKARFRGSGTLSKRHFAEGYGRIVALFQG